MLEMNTEGARGVFGAGAGTGAVAKAGATSGAGAKPPDAEAKGGGVISSDFETFLKMLTAQLRHQDPLNPLESNDFAVQLATFSGVEQQVLTNELLTGMAGGGAAGLQASWIGLEALSPAPARFDGAPLSLQFEPQPDAASAALVVTDEAGLEVGRERADPGEGRITWAGTDATGAPLPAGRYAFSLRATSADGVETAVPVLTYARVTELRPDPSGTRVVLEGGGEVAADEVAGLRAPG